MNLKYFDSVDLEKLSINGGFWQLKIKRELSAPATKECVKFREKGVVVRERKAYFFWFQSQIFCY